MRAREVARVPLRYGLNGDHEKLIEQGDIRHVEGLIG
jgi:hypothetical protein